MVIAFVCPFELGQVWLPDFLTWDSEDLAENSIAHVGCVIGTGDESTELEFDDVFNLLIGEFLHWFINYSI